MDNKTIEHQVIAALANKGIERKKILAILIKDLLSLPNNYHGTGYLTGADLHSFIFHNGDLKGWYCEKRSFDVK